MKEKKKILVVLGMHRSGTSVATRLFNLLGANPGRSLLGPADDNPTGFWEPVDIVRAHDSLLRYLGYSWCDQRPLPHKWWERPDLGEFKTRLCDLARKQYSAVQLPIIKDPRLCRLLPIWQDVLEELGWEPRYIYVVRSPLDIAGSLARRNGLSEAHSYLLWLRYVIEAEKWSRGGSRTFLRYDKLLDGWESEIKRCQYELGLQSVHPSASQKSEINGLLDVGLRHNYTGQDALESAPAILSEAYGLLQAAASGSLSRYEIQSEFDVISQNLQMTDNLYASINEKVGQPEEQVKGISADLAQTKSTLYELIVCIKALFLPKRWRVAEKAGKLASLLRMRRDH